MNDQPSPDSANTTPDTTSASAVPVCTATSQVTATVSPPASGGELQTLIRDIGQLVQILNNNPEIFQFVRMLMAK